MIVGVKRGPEEIRSAPFNEAATVKKMKVDGEPSRVIHLGNIPPDTTPAEIINIGQPFGTVTNVLLLRHKNQAFLEMADVKAASMLVSRYANQSLQLRGRSVYAQFSNHQELKTDQPNAVLRTANDSNGATGESSGGENTILRVIIDNMICPVTLDVLNQIFSRYGPVLRIVTFTKNSSFQALIQYRTESEATAAKTALDGQNIYNSCCTLRIDFSKMTTLNVKYNNDKSRDYTNPTLPSGESGDSLTGSNQQHGLTGAPGLLGSPFSVALNAPLNGSGNAMPGLAGAMPLGVSTFSVPSNGQNQVSSVLLVSNLDEKKVNPDHLFTLFGMYGNVQRVKILYNKKDCALVQMADATQATTALTHLDKLHVFGKQIHVMYSKYHNVQMPRDGQPDADLTRDYTSSPLHRFRYAPSDTYPNAHPPTCVLHLSNLPPSATDENITQEFQKNGYKIEAVKFFQKDRKMALIQLPSVDNAVDALIEMHNFEMDGNNVKVSFSKSRI